MNRVGACAPLAILFASLQGCQPQRDRPASLDCGAESTAIQSIQGLGSASRLVGSQHTVEAVVTHWLPQTDGGAVYPLSLLAREGQAYPETKRSGQSESPGQSDSDGA